jgi:hypothetical protein
MPAEATVITAIRASSFASVLLCVLATAIDARPQAPASAKSADATQPLRYVRAKSAGARVYNLADQKGVELGSAKSESLLAVYSENADFLEVEPAEGLLVWVSGKYLATTDEPGVLKVTGNGINMRPAPTSTSENSYPLSRSLNKSDKVRAESRQHPEKPLSEDWVHVWAPAGTRAWCKKAEVADASGNELASQFTSAQKESRAGAKLWVEPVAAGTTLAGTSAAAAPKAATSTPAAPTATGAASLGAAKAGAAQSGATPKTEGQKTEGQAQAAATELAKGNELYEKARTAANPDFSAAKASYLKVVDLAPNSSAAGSARAGLEKIGLHEEIARIKADKASLEVDRQARLARAEKDLREASLSNDPLWGRFQSRGWLEKQGEQWVVRWAGKVTSEVVCTSGRYDLALFQGFQLGITGALQRGASSDGPARFDVRRIEVLDGRGTTKR